MVAKATGLVGVILSIKYLHQTQKMIGESPGIPGYQNEAGLQKTPFAAGAVQPVLNNQYQEKPASLKEFNNMLYARM